MSKIKAYAAQSKEADLEPMDIERRELTDDDVKIDILYNIIAMRILSDLNIKPFYSCGAYR